MSIFIEAYLLMTLKVSDIDFDTLKDEVLSFFKEDHSTLVKVVPLEKQQHEVDLLKETLGSERFFFVIDLLNFEIQEVYGIQKWLGYSEKEFSLKQYWNQVMHPSRKQSLLLIARQLYETLCKGAYPLEFMVQRFASLTPLKHYNGHYVLAKKTSSTFQFDTGNRLTAYLNEFTIIGEYNGEALQPRMINANGEKETEKEKEIMQKAIACFLKMKVFTVNELQCIRKLAYNPDITQAEIANELNLSPHTVDTYYKRFLIKSRDFFSKEFRSVLDAALHLRHEGLL